MDRRILSELCAVHRTTILDAVQTRLKGCQPVFLIATQVVEAGVDIDFPVVMRALGPLDRIVQAAGRCNREGASERGKMVVFLPSEGGLPPGSYQVATDLTQNLLQSGSLDLHQPETYEEYFRRLYGLIDVDKKRVQSIRTNRDSALRFAEVAHRFRMIDDDAIALVVPYDETVKAMIDQVEHTGVITRELSRQFQRYTVNVYRYQTKHPAVLTAMFPLSEGWYLWTGKYDDATGIAFDAEYAPRDLLS